MSDVFSAAPTTTVVEVTVNGEHSDYDVEPGTTLKQFAIERAREAGIRTFSLYADGVKMNQENSNTDVSRLHSIEIVAKDSRG